MRLTDLHVNKLSPKSVFYDVPDGDGLYIRVMPTGTKTWIFRYMFDKRQRLMTLGRYPSISLAEARERHALARQDLEGKNPVDPGLKQKEARKARSDAKTIKGMLDEFWKIELSKKKSGPETKRLLEKDVLPRWGSRKVEDIRRRDIVLLIDTVRERAPIGANRVLGALTRFFNFAAERGIIDHSPCVGIKKPKETGRSRVLTDDEIKTLWAALELENKTIDMYRLSKLAMKMILLTGQRPGEVCGMTWDELDNGSWNIPAERMKGKEPQRVPSRVWPWRSLNKHGPCHAIVGMFSDRPMWKIRPLSRILSHVLLIGTDSKWGSKKMRNDSPPTTYGARCGPGLRPWAFLTWWPNESWDISCRVSLPSTIGMIMTRRNGKLLAFGSKGYSKY